MISVKFNNSIFFQKQCPSRSWSFTDFAVSIGITLYWRNSPLEKCWQWGLWIMCPWHCYWKEMLLLTFSNIHFQCCEHKKLNSIYLQYIGLDAEFSQMDISEPVHIYQIKFSLLLGYMGEPKCLPSPPYCVFFLYIEKASFITSLLLFFLLPSSFLLHSGYIRHFYTPYLSFSVQVLLLIITLTLWITNKWLWLWSYVFRSTL